MFSWVSQFYIEKKHKTYTKIKCKALWAKSRVYSSCISKWKISIMWRKFITISKQMKVVLDSKERQLDYLDLWEKDDKQEGGVGAFGKKQVRLDTSTRVLCWNLLLWNAFQDFNILKWLEIRFNKDGTLWNTTYLWCLFLGAAHKLNQTSLSCCIFVYWNVFPKSWRF